MQNFFETPFKGKIITDHSNNPNIIAGKYSYYSGYYHGHSFDDCARYLSRDRADVDKLIIGSFCSIGSGVSFIMAGNQGHRHDWISTFTFFYMQENDLFQEALDGFEKAGDTIVGNDVWIGGETMIMPGVTIADGAVIGSRALVTKDVGPYEIVGGNPAKLIKRRFSDNYMHKLLEMQWWYWNDELIRNAVHLLCANDIDKLYKYYKNNVHAY